MTGLRSWLVGDNFLTLLATALASKGRSKVLMAFLLALIFS